MSYMILQRLILALVFASSFEGCGDNGACYTVVGKFPHDANAFTQGLLFHDGYLYESTGLYGQSSLRKVDLESGQIVLQRPVSPEYFAEGLAWVNGTLIQLTWKAGQALVYDSDTFEPLPGYRYDTQGWGLTYDGTSLIMSDGSDTLYFRHPQTFGLIRTVQVTDNGQAVTRLNELEYIEGEIWANVWQSNDIVIISPTDGSVLRRLNFADLLTDADRNGREDVLNGIAYDAQQKRIYITGKRYSYLYQIQLLPDS